MATTVTAATLTVTVKESLTLNGRDLGTTNTQSISSIAEASTRILTVPTSEVTLVEFGASVGSGTFVRADSKYIRITNLDNTNFVRIRVADTSGHTFDVPLTAGSSMMVPTQLSVTTNQSAFSAFSNVDVVQAQADTASVDVELFVGNS